MKRERTRRDPDQEVLMRATKASGRTGRRALLGILAVAAMTVAGSRWEVAIGAEAQNQTDERTEATVAAAPAVPSAKHEVEGRYEPAAAGARVFVDPVTRKLREAEQEELQAPASAGLARRKSVATTTDASALTSLEGPGGAVGIMLDDSYMTSVVVTKHSDGSVSMEHADGLPRAEAMVRARANGKVRPAGEETNDR
jgi:hypothetical protein